MIIGFDGSRAFLGERTGTENYSYQLLKALAKIDKKNHQYFVYIRPTIFNTIVENIVWWPENFRFKVIKWPRFWTQGGLALQTFKDKLDVLFVPAHTLPLIRKPGLKTVVTVHDLGSEYLPSMHQIKQRFYLGFMQNFQLKNVTKIIAVSNATKKDLVEKVGIDPEKVSVVYEGYDKDKFKDQKSKIKINQTLKKYNLIDQNYFLFVGTVQPRKNLERLIKAFYEYMKVARGPAGSVSRRTSSLANRSLRSCAGTPSSPSPLATNLVIAGSKGWLANSIYRLPKRLGIEERVKFLGYVQEEDLQALYSGAIALTFPSLFEGFGLPILEAQASGCPVLTSNVSSMPEVGGLPAGGGAVYVNPYSVGDIVRGMRKCQMSNIKYQMIKAGFENVKRFSWEKCARETLEVILSFL